jgi:hypothetical protein
LERIKPSEGVAGENDWYDEEDNDKKANKQHPREVSAAWRPQVLMRESKEKDEAKIGEQAPVATVLSGVSLGRCCSAALRDDDAPDCEWLKEDESESAEFCRAWASRNIKIKAMCFIDRHASLSRRTADDATDLLNAKCGVCCEAAWFTSAGFRYAVSRGRNRIDVLLPDGC